MPRDYADQFEGLLQTVSSTGVQRLIDRIIKDLGRGARSSVSIEGNHVVTYRHAKIEISFLSNAIIRVNEVDFPLKDYDKAMAYARKVA